MTQVFPNFMVVGAAKCGTTSLFHYLGQHPEVCAPTKETYFVTPKHADRVGYKGQRYTLEGYRALFDQGRAPGVKMAGEVSSAYLYTHAEAAPTTRDTLGDIKIVIMLRDPVARAYSHYLHFARDMRDKRTFAEAVDEELAQVESETTCFPYVRMGLYHDQVATYLDTFSSVFVGMFDDLVSDAGGLMVDLFHFLGVDEGFRPKLERFNVSGLPKSKVFQRLFLTPTPFKLRLKSFLMSLGLPERHISSQVDRLRRFNLAKQPMDTEVRTRLHSFYSEDLQKLGALLGRDLSGWLAGA